jgi:hypothetical protein
MRAERSVNTYEHSLSTECRGIDAAGDLLFLRATSYNMELTAVSADIDDGAPHVAGGSVVYPVRGNARSEIENRRGGL